MNHTIVHDDATVLLVPLDETAARASQVCTHDNPMLFVLLGKHPRPSFIAVGSWIRLTDLASLIHNRFELDMDTAMGIAAKAIAVIPKSQLE
jgi:hypothetical protein